LTTGEEAWSALTGPQKVPTLGRKRGRRGVAGVREAGCGDKKQKFTALLHHVTTGLLRDSYYALKKRAAARVYGMTWRQYGEGVEEGPS